MLLSPEVSLSVLNLTALAKDGQYMALATLVHHANSEEALGALAASARDPKALAWVVALLGSKLPPEDYQAYEQGDQEAYVRQLDDHLPEDLVVPGDLQDMVKSFILTAPAQVQDPLLRGEAQARVLRNLRAEDSFALDLAETLLSLELPSIGHGLRRGRPSQR